MMEYLAHYKKNILKIVICVLFIWIFFFFFTHSIVTVTGLEKSEKNIYIQKEGEESLREFTLSQGSKTFILPKGSYAIGVSSGNEFSEYTRVFGGLSKHNLDVETFPQKKSISLGNDEFDCAHNLGKQVVFYPCSDYAGVLSSRSNGTQKFLLDPVLGNASAGVHTENNGLTSFGLKPYGDGFLSVATKNNQLIVKQLDESGRPRQKSTANEFKDVVDTNNLSAEPNEGGRKFSALDRKSGVLFVFNDINDNNPKRIDISKELNKDTGGSKLIRLTMSSSEVMVIVTQDPSELEDHSQLKNEPEENHQNKTRNRIIIVNIDKASVDKVANFPDDITPIRYATGLERIIFVPLYQTEKTLLLFEKSKFSEFEIAGGEIKDVCWVNNDGLIYSTTEGEIFRYSLVERTSFKLYGSLNSTVNNLSCDFGDISFTLNSENDGVVDELVHYALSEEPSIGSRPEWFLPLYFTASNDNLKLTQKRELLLIEFLFDTNRNGRKPQKDTAQKAAEQELRNLGVNTENLEFIFNY